MDTRRNWWWASRLISKDAQNVWDGMLGQEEGKFILEVLAATLGEKDLKKIWTWKRILNVDTFHPVPLLRNVGCASACLSCWEAADRPTKPSCNEIFGHLLSFLGCLPFYSLEFHFWWLLIQGAVMTALTDWLNGHVLLPLDWDLVVVDRTDLLP